MQYIKAPFNFVPVYDQVFFPDWADQISHDIPFSDDLCGQIKIEIKAETPIFIRDSEKETRFCHIVDENGQCKYFIPGTSLKGTIRSVFEILTFAKMDRINDHKYAIRDLHNPLVYNLMTDSANIRCGWLSLKKDYMGKEIGSIRDCGIPWRISHKQLDDNFGTSLVDTFKIGSTVKFKKTAEYKYDLCAPRKITDLAKFEATTQKDNRQLCKFSSTGQAGRVVLTGQAGPRGKFYEFVFINSSNPAFVEVEAKTWSEFKFHYFDHDTKRISADWKWRKGQLALGQEIPIFFRTIEQGKRTLVKDLGLAYLYKMPYKYSVKERLPYEHRMGFLKPDLAECVFGYTDDEDALKGRVQFSNAWEKPGTTSENSIVSTILGSPKASYYPIYIKQENVAGIATKINKRPDYKTFMNSNAELAGRKKYPMRDYIPRSLPPGTEGMGVKFTPLRTGATFISTINYFNLRKIELGALLSALTFHNNASECYHGLGMAKPYGFGRVSLKIAGINESEMTTYLEEFESAITAYMQVDSPGFEWHQSDPIKQFIAMSKIQKIEDDRMNYMPLADFAEAKKKEKGFCLEDYCSIVNDHNGVKSFAKKDKLEKAKVPARILRENLKIEIVRFKEKERLHREKQIREEQELDKPKDEEKKQKEEQDRLKILKEKEEAEKRRLDETKQKQFALQAEINKKQQEELARIAERNEKLKAIGLEPLIQSITDFDKAKKQIEPYMKRIGINQLDEKDTGSLLKRASDWYFATPNKQRENRWKPTEGPDWKKIASWIGSDLAQKWYNDLIAKG